MKYKDFELDAFQEEAIRSLEKNRTVVVSAATGTGKTLIADYLINMYVNSGERIVYTAPIKALSNQKYEEFTTEYGHAMIGILTGDVQINPDAPVVIMTTEIYRNMLLSMDPVIDDISYVIFDEVHYLSDVERGTIWEESIIFSPEHVRFLCLSATIPNAQQFADWIKSIKKHPVDVVEWHQRLVPLKFDLFDDSLNFTTSGKLKRAAIEDQEKARLNPRRKKKGMPRSAPAPDHTRLVEQLEKKNRLPALMFYFSRKDTQNKALELAHRFDFSTHAGRKEAERLFDEHVPENIRTLQSVKDVKFVVEHGIGFHNAGLLPGLKKVVELLFSRGHIKVLYTTETFALGINMPVRTVAINGLRKFDGRTFRNLERREFHQCAGRAGRRGLDKEGFVVTMLPRNVQDIKAYNWLIAESIEPMESSFKLSYNTVLNLVKNHPEEVRLPLLKSSFDYYSKKRDKKHGWVTRRYRQYTRNLEQWDYIDRYGELTEKGKFASRIYTNEIPVSEFFGTGMYKGMEDVEVALMLAVLVYEEKRSDRFYADHSMGFARRLVERLEDNLLLYRSIDVQAVKKLEIFVSTWYHGGSFEKLLDMTSKEEGDIIRIFRNMIDLARQVKAATQDTELQDAMFRIIDRIDRDVVRVYF